jgi:hypothetical protein
MLKSTSKCPKLTLEIPKVNWEINYRVCPNSGNCERPEWRKMCNKMASRAVYAEWVLAIIIKRCR